MSNGIQIEKISKNTKIKNSASEQQLVFYFYIIGKSYLLGIPWVWPYYILIYLN